MGEKERTARSGCCATMLGPSRGRKTCQLPGCCSPIVVFSFKPWGSSTHLQACARVYCSLLPSAWGSYRQSAMVLAHVSVFWLAQRPSPVLVQINFFKILTCLSLTYCMLDETCTAFLTFKELVGQTCLPR